MHHPQQFLWRSRWYTAGTKSEPSCGLFPKTCIPNCPVPAPGSPCRDGCTGRWQRKPWVAPWRSIRSEPLADVISPSVFPIPSKSSGLGGFLMLLSVWDQPRCRCCCSYRNSIHPTVSPLSVSAPLICCVPPGISLGLVCCQHSWAAFLWLHLSCSRTHRGWSMWYLICSLRSLFTKHD